jgi:hypothetical protein
MLFPVSLLPLPTFSVSDGRLQVMEDEIIRGMRLLGVTRLEQLKPEMLRYLERDVHLPAARLPRQKPV